MRIVNLKRRGKRSKYWRCRITGDSFFYTLNNIEDLVDRDKNYAGQFKFLRELFGIHGSGAERKAIAMGNAITRDVFKLILTDMIMDNDYFVFPAEKFGYMKISDMTNEDREDYVYNFETQGRYFGARLMLDRSVQRLNKKHYRIKLSEANIKRIYNQVTQHGKSY
ncbi:MAG: hypothetical protein ABIW84_01575 [Ilumatobacteraceae bacterium]